MKYLVTFKFTNGREATVKGDDLTCIMEIGRLLANERGTNCYQVVITVCGGGNER